jgi:glycosyltransferase involved in cell wall biosynthesis
LAILDSQPNYERSYPTKVFEYMALGLPVITSAFPLYKGIVEESSCGVCVTPGNIDQLVNAIVLFARHPEKIEEMGRNGREAARRQYNWANEFVKLDGCYRSMLSAK